ncbi:hypothetical protein [Actinomycetospora sp. CA-084318]|uniref:hypothetical protein n=1 Tax=Actinomycetospora sp. CA-084318 TaxID=3239892 RepID=UPI003D992353
MRIRLQDGPCAGEHDVRVIDTAPPPEEYLVLVEKGPRTPTDGVNGGTIPGVNVFAVHRLARRDPDGTPVYGFAGNRFSRGY